MTVPPGARILFVNNDGRRHDMTSDDHPDHLECPALNQVGCSPGQNRESGNLVVVRTCGFHDHEDPNNNNLKGKSCPVLRWPRWRDEFPTVDERTICEPLARRDAAPDGGEPPGLRRHLEPAAACRAWHEGWWEIGQTTGDLLAPILGVPAGSISMHQNVTVVMGIIASCFRYDGPRRKIVLTELEFPTIMYLFEGFARYGAQIVYVDSDTRQ